MYLIGQISVQFDAPDDWTEVYCYVWAPDDFLGGWPGTLMTDEGGGWYSISTDTLSSGNFIFNNGTGDGAVQTVFVGLTTGSYCYGTTGNLVGTELEIEELPCETSIDTEKNKQGSSEINIYPNPSEGIIQLQSAKSIERVEIYSTAGVLLMDIAALPLSRAIDVSDFSSGLYLVSVSFSDGKRVNQKLIRK